MKIRRLISAGCSIALFAACTIYQQNGQPVGEFHPPFVTPQWQASRATSRHGNPVCMVSSGYNGITLTIPVSSQGKAKVVSNRMIMPGNRLVITVNGDRYETPDMAFSARDAQAIIKDFMIADKAYADWSESNGSQPGMQHITNIFRLDYFRHELEACKSGAA